MKFKDIRNLIFADLILVVNGKEIFDVELSELDSRYDNYEVIGIRSDCYDHISYIILSLRDKYVIDDDYIDLGPIKENTFGTTYISCNEK